MAHLSIRLFGGLEVRRDGEILPAFPTERAKHLFAFLVLHPERLFHRDVLCGRLWGDRPQDDARKTLRTALWRIRSALEPADDDDGRVIRSDGQQIGVPGTASVEVDAWEFESHVEASCGAAAEVLDTRGVQCCRRVASLYRGDLLEGVYAEWATCHRERFRLAYLTCLERLMAYYRQREEWLDAITWGRTLLRRDPLREHVHRTLMECHFARGDRPSALRRYEECARILASELGIQPMPETRRLRQRILGSGGDDEGDGGSAGRVAPCRSRGSGGREIGGMVQEVDGALEELYALAHRLERTREALRHRSGGGSDQNGRAAAAGADRPSAAGR